MKFFDLHCDTIEELRKRNETFDHCSTQFNMENQKKMEAMVQVLAVWVPDGICGQEAVDFVDDYTVYMEAAVKKIENRGAIAKDPQSLKKIVQERKWAFIPSIENGAALGGNIENIDHFMSAGYQMMTLTWNGHNELGSGVQAEGGLTDFGKEAVRYMEKKGMIIDCSHLNDEGFEDLLNHSSKPFVASHSNLRSCCNHPRNLREDQFKEIVKRGGLCGINLYSRFLSNPDDGGRGQKEQLLRLIDRMLELGGEDVIAWGMDLDGEITCDPFIGTPYGAVVYGGYLKAHGINTEIIDKLFFNNAYRFFCTDL